MKIYTIIPILSIFILSGFAQDKLPDESHSNENQEVRNSIEWYDFESVQNLSNNTDKKYFIYVYTNSCPWCRRMSSTSFQNKEIIDLLNTKFIPVKFNADSQETILFRDYEFKYISNSRNGYHQLAASLLNNKLVYPSIVFLDKEMKMIQALSGYKKAKDLSIILHYLGDKIYETMSFDEYQEKIEQ